MDIIAKIILLVTVKQVFLRLIFFKYYTILKALIGQGKSINKVTFKIFISLEPLKNDKLV